jgi:uncharacterized membrane protein
MVVEVEVVGYTNAPPLQALYIVLGALMLLIGATWHRRAWQAAGEARRLQH